MVTGNNHSLVTKTWFQWSLLVASVAVAFVLGRVSITSSVSTYDFWGQCLVSFFVGALYSSVLTVAPATVGLAELAQAGVPVPVMGFFGGLGAMCADLTLFRVIKLGLIDRVVTKLQSRHGVYGMLLEIKLFRYVIAAIGAISIATPIPDEIGLALMGMGNAHWGVVAIIGFIFNAIGIAAIGIVAG